MFLKEFIWSCLDQAYWSLSIVVKGLTPEELAWRPAASCNSIGFLAWHCARATDLWVQRVIRSQPELWVEEWAAKCNRPPDPTESGFGYTDEQLEKFQVPPEEVLLGYLEATRIVAKEYLDEVDDTTLATVAVASPSGGRITNATVLQVLLWELHQHGGQMAYLRGLRRGDEGLYDSVDALKGDGAD